MSENESPCILVIDNDERIVEAISARLVNHGYRCVTAANGQDGLSEFSPEDVDLIITDLNMPALDGVGFVKQIRSTSQVPIIIVTGYSDQYRHRIRKFPNVTVLQKPFETHALIDLVEIELAQRSNTSNY